jgi:hypothetical protein
LPLSSFTTDHVVTPAAKLKCTTVPGISLG